MARKAVYAVIDRVGLREHQINLLMTGLTVQ